MTVYSKMNNMGWKRALLGVILVFAAGSVSAQELTEAEQETLEAVLATSQVWDQLQNVDEGFMNMVMQQGRDLEAEQVKQLGQLSAEAFEDSTLYRYMLDYMAERYDAGRIDSLNSWLHAPLAAQVRAEAEEPTEPDQMQALRAYATEIRQNPPPEERVALMQRYSSAMNAPAFYVENIAMLVKAARRATNLVQNQETDEAELEQELDAVQEQLQNNAAAISLISFLYMYREMPVEQLEPYVDFYDSELGRWYTHLYADAFLYALERSAASLNAALAQEGSTG